MSDFECIVNADLFRRAQMCVSKEETRYYLNGVHIEPAKAGGALLVATDGHVMVVLHDPSALVRGSGIVRLEKQMVTALSTKTMPGYAQTALREGKNPLNRRLIVQGNRAAVLQLGSDRKLEPEVMETLFEHVIAPSALVIAYQWAWTVIDGTYPGWRRVVPEIPETPAPMVDPVNVDKLMQVCTSLSAGPDSACSIVPTGADGAIIVLPQDKLMAGRGFGIVMPLRRKETPIALPPWMNDEEYVPPPAEESTDA